MEAIRTDDAGRRWRYVFPASKALLAAVLLAGGIILTATGFALGILAVGITGALCLVPGAYASWQLVRVWRGDATVPPAWLSVEELPDV